MKNAISKPGALALGLLLLIGTCMVSCKKDMDDAPSLRDQIAGAWTITSFAIDGLEMIDLVLESSTLELEIITNSKAGYIWVFIYIDGSRTNAGGSYQVDEAARELTFDSGTADEATYRIDLNGDILKLSGTFDGSTYKLKLER